MHESLEKLGENIVCRYRTVINRITQLNNLADEFVNKYSESITSIHGFEDKSYQNFNGLYLFCISDNYTMSNYSSKLKSFDHYRIWTSNNIEAIEHNLLVFKTELNKFKNLKNQMGDDIRKITKLKHILTGIERYKDYLEKHFLLTFLSKERNLNLYIKYAPRGKTVNNNGIIVKSVTDSFKYVTLDVISKSGYYRTKVMETEFLISEIKHKITNNYKDIYNKHINFMLLKY